MRYLFGFLCVCALGVVALVGCGETAGDGRGLPCTERGIRDAIAEGGGPHTFECTGPTTVVTDVEIIIDNDVILDGEGNLAVDGNRDHRVFSVSTGVTAELRGITVTRGSAQNAGPVDGIEVIGRRTFGGGIVSVGTLTLTDTTVLGNYAAAGGGIYSEGTLMLRDSAVSDNEAKDSETPGAMPKVAAYTTPVPGR